MGQIQSSGEFAFDPDEWEQERTTGQYRPRRRSADGRPFVRPRTPLQFGTIPTALPVNPADYVDTTVRRRAVDIDDWDAKLGTEEYSAPEHVNIAGVDPREEAQMADQRYEEFLKKLFACRAGQAGTLLDVSNESSRSIRHGEIDSSVAKPKLQPIPVQAESAINRTSKKHRLERSSSENISSRQSPKIEQPPVTSASYENLLDKAFPKRRAQMQQRHQRQQQQLQKLPDPPKPPAYRNPNIKPENLRRSASTTLLVDPKKRSASVDSPASTSLGSETTPSRSTTDQTKRLGCECRKCSGNPQSTELHKPPQVTGNTPNVSAMSSTNPGPGRITVDMHLRVHMDLPTSSSPTVSVTSTPTIQHQTSSTFLNPHPNYPRTAHSQSNMRYTPVYASHDPHQYQPATQPLAPSRVAHTSSSPIHPSVYYSSNQHHQYPNYYTPLGSHHHQQKQSYLTPQSQPQEQRAQPSPLHRSQTTPDIRLHPSQRQQSYLKMEQQRAAYTRAHLSQLRALQTQSQAQGNQISFSPGGYSLSPSPNTIPVPPFSAHPFSQLEGTVPRMGPGKAAEEVYADEEDEEEEENDDDDDPYHDKRYGV